MNEIKQLWASAFLLSSEHDISSSSLRELKEYFPNLESAEIKSCFQNGTELLANHWEQTKVDPKSEESLKRFYNETDLEIFELMHYHSEGIDDGPLNYVYSLELAMKHECRSYLDYGSGIGSGGILFARHGFKVTLCDIATPLLNFARWRFKKRGLQGTFVDLKQTNLACQVDFITCFEVLEHVRDPLGVLRKIHGYLRNGGFLVVTAPFTVDEKRPMHIVHNHRLIDKFRAQGFEMRWDLKNSLRGKMHEPFFIMQKVKRSKFKNLSLEIFDYYIPESIKSFVFRLLKPRKPVVIGTSHGQ